MLQLNYVRKVRSVSMLLAMLALSSCMTSVSDSPDKEALRSMSFEDARDTVKRASVGYGIVPDFQESRLSGRSSGQGGGHITAVIVTRDMLDVVTDNKPYRFQFAALQPKMQDTFYTGGPDSYAVWLDAKWAIIPDRNAGSDNARSLLDALFYLKQSAPATPAIPDDVAFEKIAADYRAQATPPAIGPETEKYSIQAEDAVRQKNNIQAVELYCRALAASPWWPQGHFNVALVLAEVGDYGWASNEMKRYLLLVPHADNADAVQKKIYEWELRAGEN
ncbi:MAG TPA: hypothetical protein VF651_07365 [Gammaproteobacteria bacterium]